MLSNSRLLFKIGEFGNCYDPYSCVFKDHADFLCQWSSACATVLHLVVAQLIFMIYAIGGGSLACLNLIHIR